MTNMRGSSLAIRARALVQITAVFGTTLFTTGCALAPGSTSTPSAEVRGTVSPAAPTPQLESSAPPPAPTTSPRADWTPLPTGGLTEAGAIEIARGFLTDLPDGGELWTTFAGPYGEASAKLVDNRSLPDQPVPDYIEPERLIWAVQFAVTLEVCGPAVAGCTHRPGLRIVFLDYFSGDWLEASDYGPAPGQPLPTPLPR